MYIQNMTDRILQSDLKTNVTKKIWRKVKQRLEESKIKKIQEINVG